jgi:putative transcriptional regulator
MATVRRQNNSRPSGRVNPKVFLAAGEAAKARWDAEDGFNEADYGEERFVVPSTDVRSLRENLGLSQEAFSERYRLPLRTIQEWEQHRREPSEPARVLLFAIANAPQELEQALSLSWQADRKGKREQ